MMKNCLRGLIFTTFFYTRNLYACPSCVGSTVDGKDTIVSYLLMGFIILVIIVPYTVILQLVLKNKKSTIE